MSNKIHVQPLGWLACTLDVLMVPIMCIISGTFREVPQQTHAWNNTKLKPEQVQHLKIEMKVYCGGIKSVKERWWSKLPLFHIPIFGGWKDYVVLRPTDDQVWHIGWVAHDVIGVSRIAVKGPVRVLLGPEATSYFGLDAKGKQIKLSELSRGQIGDGGTFKNTPLL